MQEFNIKESFSWLAPESFKVESIGKNTVKVRGVALRADAISKNNRKYVKEELVKAARTWINKPVTINHDPNKIAGHIDWMEFEDPLLEYLMTIKKQPYVNMFRNHDPNIRGVSVEADYLYNRCAKCGERFYDEETWHNHMVKEHLVKDLPTEPHGIKGTFLSIVVKPEVPGVPGTSTELWETLQKSSPLRLLEIVTTVKKEQIEWRTKMDKATAVVSTPSSIAIGKGKKPKLTEQEEKDEHGCVKGKEEWKDGKCVSIPPKATEQEQTVQDLPEPTVEPPVECPMGFEPDGVGGCKPKEWQAEPTADTPAPLMVPEPTIEPAKVAAPPIPAPAQAAGPLIEQEEEQHSMLPPAPFPTTPTEEPAISKECPVGSHWDKIGGTCVPDDIVEQPPSLEGRVDAGADIIEFKLPSKLTLAEPCDWSKTPYTSHDDCVSKNRDKGDPDAYCASIGRQVGGETVKETEGNIYNMFREHKGHNRLHHSQLAETANLQTTATAKLYNHQRLLERQAKKTTLTEAMLREHDNRLLKHGINKYAKSVNETILKLNAGFKPINEHMKTLSETANKNTRYMNTKLSQLATALGKSEAKLKETVKAQDAKIESQKKDYEKVVHLIEKVKDEEISSLEEKKKALEQELEKRKCGEDEHYDDEQGKCVPNKPKEPEETAETKKLKETVAKLQTDIENLQAKQRGDFKGTGPQVKKEEPSYSDPYKEKQKKK